MFLSKLRGCTFCITVLTLGLGCQLSGNTQSRKPRDFLNTSEEIKEVWAISRDSRKVVFTVSNGAKSVYVVQIRDLKRGALLSKMETKTKIYDVFFRTDGQVVFVTDAKRDLVGSITARLCCQLPTDAKSSS